MKRNCKIWLKKINKILASKKRRKKKSVNSSRKDQKGKHNKEMSKP